MIAVFFDAIGALVNPNYAQDLLCFDESLCFFTGACPMLTRYKVCLPLA